MEKLQQNADSLRNKNRLRWACRRGMLELDVLFAPFVEEAYDDLDEQQQDVFRRLLTCDDPDLFAWFMGHQPCEDEELRGMVEFILSRVKV
ncbi:succinate dehydrogenase assembly factor 2 family protein [Pseudidiomarina sediminum]|uniref:FAD assembly factor SdhE n=1 Tax=Pseudidiomarina sediminum TaxID=431675 RepID=A0A432Z836_9GAMM|nr:succinate dehydrogenase assembly factor 2 [Pseudidiomarina sediminum]MBY6063196.1 succinate dehydrogenase assembly factor 2 [Pseudidiomarina sediminum]RUO74042.1 succinate dehydrogenase assembly factor 2 family protein [Pseudidiomarina sediminum]